ncbi:hypothetical protein MED222_05840 [Vibrio sp. MED222]|nr:hypothetical protein MED222_05840 [Vibrio sp. MED222]
MGFTQLAHIVVRRFLTQAMF